jgi:hypothetical protein
MQSGGPCLIQDHEHGQSWSHACKWSQQTRTLAVACQSSVG